METRKCHQDSFEVRLAERVALEAMRSFAHVANVHPLNAQTCLIDVMVSSMAGLSPDGALGYLDALRAQVAAKVAGDQAAFQAAFDDMVKAVQRLQADVQAVQESGTAKRQ